MHAAEPLDAGDFRAWAEGLERALHDDVDDISGAASDVPCGECTACCTSSQFIHIEPDEKQTLARIPSDLLFPAPLRPVGHVVMGFDERGHCPMLVDSTCSIYGVRPRTCRTYDCRVLAASGIELGEPTRQRIALQCGLRLRTCRLTAANSLLVPCPRMTPSSPWWRFLPVPSSEPIPFVLPRWPSRRLKLLRTS
jgi:hypothetical protein